MLGGGGRTRTDSRTSPSIALIGQGEVTRTLTCGELVPVGGGPGVAEWVLNIGVGSDYDRTDLSEHAGEVAADLGLRGTAGSPATEVPAVGGTINLVVQLPVGLDPGAAVNAVITATEAQAQALATRGVPGTGTATDAVAIVWPADAAAERFAGPRSRWGSRIAQAVYQAVWAGAEPRA